MGLIDKNIPKPKPSALGNKSSAASHLASAAVARGAGAAGTAAVMGIRSLEAASGMRFDPAPAYLFFIELSGVIVSLFTECEGIEVERDVQEVEEGGVNNYVHKLPGRLKQSNITLKRGLSVSRALWDWMMQGRYNCDVRKINFSIIQGAPGHNLVTAAMEVTAAPGSDATAGEVQSYSNTVSRLGQGFGKVKHWDVEGAYPVKWKISDLNTSSGDTVIESIEIAHHGISLSYEAMTPMSLVAAGDNPETSGVSFA